MEAYRLFRSEAESLSEDGAAAVRAVRSSFSVDVSVDSPIDC